MRSIPYCLRISSMSALFVRKGRDNQYHLVGNFSNRWRDHDFHAAPEQGGEIIASSAHGEYEKWLDKNPQHAPQLWVWHAYGSAFKSRAEWWAWSGNFFWMSWPLTEDEAKAVEGWAGEEDLGMSFGFYALKYDDRDAVIERYRAFEASILPREAAANKWTGVELVGGDTFKGDTMFSDKKMAALRRFFGDEKVQAIVGDDATLAQILDEAGIDSKELSADPAEETVQTGETADTEVKATAEDSAGDANTSVTDAKAATTGEIEALVVNALQRLEAALSADLKVLAEKVTAQDGELANLRTALVEMQEREEAEAKAAAMPPSILASYVPRSILDSGETGKGAKESSAAIDGRSTLAKSGPAAPQASYASKLLGIQ